MQVADQIDGPVHMALRMSLLAGRRRALYPETSREQRTENKEQRTKEPESRIEDRGRVSAQRANVRRPLRRRPCIAASLWPPYLRVPSRGFAEDTRQASPEEVLQ